MQRVYILLSFVVFTSCYRESIIDIDQSFSKDRLVVYSLLSPQADSIFVSLSKTTSDFEQYFDTAATLPEGNVIIKGDGKEVYLKKLSAIPTLYGCSQKEFKINPGIEYSLSVQITGFDTATATTTIPANYCRWENAKAPTYIATENVNGVTEYGYKFEAEWILSNNTFESNAYAVKSDGIAYQLKYTPEKQGYRNFYYSVTDTFELNEWLFMRTKQENTHTINERNYFETTIYEDIEYSIKTANYSPTGRVYNRITLYLYTFDANYTETLNTLAKENELTPSSEMDMFTLSSAVLPVFTNINGGYGVFGSYGFDSIAINVSPSFSN